MNNKVVKNAGWIICVQIIKSLITLLISMFTARYLGPANYGIINYASSIVAFVSPIVFLGLTETLVHEIINNKQEEGEVLGTSIAMSICSSVVCVLGIVCFTLIANKGEFETTAVCFLYSLLLVFQSIELLRYWFQERLLSKYHSIISLFAYILVSLYKIYLLITQKSIYWFAISNTLDYLIIASGLLIAYKKLGIKKLCFSFDRAKKLLSTSRYYILANIMVSVFAQTDHIMIKLMLGNKETGYYSAGVVCAGITGFIFSAIIESFRPTILENKNNDKIEYQKSLCVLYSLIIYGSLIQCLVISIFSYPIIYILYGKSFLESVSVLRIIVWYTTFSYLGGVRNIWLLAENKQKEIWKINLSGALFNVILNYFLIPVFGICGAAVASLVTQFFTNVIVGFIMPQVRENNRIMIESLKFRYLIFGIQMFLKPKKRRNNVT